MPVRGSKFAKVTQLLRELSIVSKCDEEGWNDLGDQILRTLREPFRSVIPFQFQPNQQCQLRCSSNRHPFVSAPSDVEVHRRELRSLPSQGTHHVIKPSRKNGTTSVKRQLQSLARDLAPRQTPHTEESFPLVACQGHHASELTVLRCNVSLREGTPRKTRQVRVDCGSNSLS